MVGIAGGAPSSKHDIRLGDVVVSCPQATHTGVIQYDYGKAIQNKEFQVTGHLAAPPQKLLTALSSIISRHERKGHNIADTIARMLLKNRRLQAKYAQPDPKSDRLYRSSFIHSSAETCDCELPLSSHSAHSLLVSRVERKSEDDTTVVHYGLVASANQLMKDANARDALIRQHDVLCFEMEAAGLMNDLPCLVIRGICDYSDTHKNDNWQGYAAAVAAAYAKELLEIIPGLSDPQKSDLHGGTHSHFVPDQTALIEQADFAIRDFYTSSGRLKIERLSGEALPMDKCYINLLLQQKSKRPSDEALTQPITLKKRLETQDATENEYININEIFSSRKATDSTDFEPRRIFIQGRAGIGKTTLCKKIAFEFLQNRLGHKLFDRLLWFNLRSLDSSNNVRYSWAELLHDAIPLSGQIAEWQDLVAVMSNHLSKPEVRGKTLFLLDGLDEISRDWKHDDKSFQFLESLICNAPNLIITSRPQAKSLKIGDFDLELEAVGFTREQISTYIKYCMKDEQTILAMDKSVAGKPFLQDLLRIPVQLDAFCCTWNTDSTAQHASAAENVTTMTGLYQEIMIELCWKDLIRTGRSQGRDTPAGSGILDLLKKELSIIELFAFQGLVNNIIEFSPRHQEQIEAYQRRRGHSSNSGQTSALEELSFIRTSDHHLHHRKRNYYFMHLTYQEFFAARYFVQRWRSGRKFTRLHLKDSSTSLENRIAPADFLQREKYNPRYIVFWRFVAGLTQEESTEPRLKTNPNTTAGEADRNGSIAFFELLNGNPRDLLGAQHSRLLMYCLSEITICCTRAMRHMRAGIEDCLYTNFLLEYRVTGEMPLAFAADFPEIVLCRLLREPWHVSRYDLLSALRSRPSLASETLNTVLESISDDDNADLRMKAIQVIFNHSDLYAKNFDEPMERAVKMFRTMLCDRGKRAQTVLSWHIPLPSTLIHELLLIYSATKSMRTQKSILETLGKQHSLSLEVATALIPALDHNDFGIRAWAFEALNLKPRTPEVLSFFTSALYNKSSNIRIASARVLSHNPLLPRVSIDGLTSLLKDTDEQVRSGAINALASQSRLSQEIMTACLERRNDPAEKFDEATWLILRNKSSSELGNLILSNKLLKHKAVSIRETTLRMLQGQRNIPEKLLQEIVAMLKDGDWKLKQTVSTILRSQLPLPQTCVTSLVVLMKDENLHVRRSAVRIFGAGSDLGPKDVQVLIALLRDEDQRVREDTAIALGNQSLLTDPAVRALTNAIEDEVYGVRLAAINALRSAPELKWQCIDLLLSVFIHEDFNMREAATKALILQSSFSKAQVDRLISVLESESPYVRESASRILCAQSLLSTEAIQSLVSMYRQDEYKSQFAVTVLAEHFSRPREKIESMLDDLEDEPLSVRCAAMEGLASKAPQLQSSISLVSWLKATDESLRGTAFQLLNERSSLPEDASLALVGLLSSKDYKIYQNARHLLERHSPLSESTLAQLIALAQDKDHDAQWKAVMLLERHPKLPQRMVEILLKALEKEYSRDDIEGYRDLTTTGVVSFHARLPLKIVKSLIYKLKDDVEPNQTYAILHRNDIYSVLGDLDEGEWSELLSFWHGHTFSSRHEFCIYGIDSTLCIWTDGTLHQVRLGTDHIQKFSQLSRRVRRKGPYTLPWEFQPLSSREKNEQSVRLAITGG